MIDNIFIDKTQYYECHITIEPVVDPYKLKRLEEIAKHCDFKIAKLYKQNGQTNKDDAFLTSRSRSFTTIKSSCGLMIGYLRSEGFNLRRSKIEAIIEDKKYET